MSHLISSKQSAESFLDACGGGPLLLSVDDAAWPAPARYELAQPFVVAGRDPGVDLMLDHRKVSRRHAYLQLVGGRLFCMDLGSRSGTVWDDGADRSGWLDPDRYVRLGPFELRRFLPDSTDAPRRASGPAPDFEVEHPTRSGRPTRRAVDRDLLIVGSSPECGVHLPFSDVSRAHCSLVKAAGGLWVVDLFGRGGVQVNGEPVRFSRVDDGDEIRVGRQVLWFRALAGAAPRPPSGPPGDPVAGLPSGPGRPGTLVPAGQGPTPQAPAPTASVAVPAVAWQYPEGEADRVLAARHGSDAEMIRTLMEPMARQFSLMQQQMFEQFHQAMMAMFQTFGALQREQMADLRDEVDEVRRLTRELQELHDQAASALATPAPPIVANPAPPSPTRPTPEPPRRPGPEPEADEEPTLRPPPPKTDPAVHGLLFDKIARLQSERQTRWQKIMAMMNRTPE